MSHRDTARVLFAGLDVSTQSAKLVIIDPAAGAVVHIDRVDYDRDLPRYGTQGGAIQGLGEGVSESDPAMWIEAVGILLQRLSGGRSEGTGSLAAGIRCIAQDHGLAAIERNLKELALREESE